MGTWGTGISSNDVFADVYGEFFDLYNDGGDPGEISRKIIKDNWEMIDIPEDNHNFWFALARAQWECKQLAPEVFETVRSIIESGKDIDLWRNLGSNEKDIRKREIVLEKFLQKLSSERTKPLARKKRKILQPPFNKRSCLTFKLSNGNYGGAVVLEAIPLIGYAYNLVAVTRIDSVAPPKLKDFTKADILTLTYGKWENTPAIHWMTLRHFADDKGLFEKVGEIEVSRQFDTSSSEYGFCGGWKIWIIDAISSQFEHEKGFGVPKEHPKISDFLRERWWKFW
jgi:hypothetical protein